VRQQVKLLTKATAASVANLQSDAGGKKHDVLVTTPVPCRAKTACGTDSLTQHTQL
jgi:hypothetical protein